MSVWLVRAGKHGEIEDEVLNNGITAIGWMELPDLSNIKSREELKDLFDKVYPGMKKRGKANEVGQVWTFMHRIKVGDLVVLPSKFRASIAIGNVTGPYKYRTDLSDNTFHTRTVDWITTDIPRTAFDQDILYSLGAFMTVCQIQRNNAEVRIKNILNGKPGGSGIEKGNGTDTGDITDDVDVEGLSSDQIVDYVNRKFKGHDLSRLVEAVLQAQGYVTENAKPGADGGVDILAGTGPMGFGNPRICVQVKSSKTPVDVTILRSLQGAMSNFGAEQGLLVSWADLTELY